MSAGSVINKATVDDLSYCKVTKEEARKILDLMEKFNTMDVSVSCDLSFFRAEYRHFHISIYVSESHYFLKHFEYDSNNYYGDKQKATPEIIKDMQKILRKFTKEYKETQKRYLLPRFNY